MRMYRASSLGYSLENLVAPYLGYEPVAPPDTLQTAYDEGNRLEPIILQHLRDHGWEIDGEQTEVTIEIIPGEVAIVGHVDGFTVDKEDDKLVLEIKTMSTRNFLDWARNGWGSNNPLIEKYKWQASAYMIATGLPHIMIAWDKGSEYPSTAVWEAEEPFYPVKVLADKVLAAEQAIRDGVLPEGCEDFPCPYFYLHADKESIPTVQADDNLEELLIDWLAADRAEKAAKRDKDLLRKAITSLTDDASVGKVVSKTGVTISTNWVEGKHVEYDVKAHWETRIQGPRK